MPISKPFISKLKQLDSLLKKGEKNRIFQYEAYLLVKGYSSKYVNYNFSKSDRKILQKDYPSIYDEVLNLPIEMLFFADAGMHNGMKTTLLDQPILQLLNDAKTWNNSLLLLELLLQIVAQASLLESGSKEMIDAIHKTLNQQYSTAKNKEQLNPILLKHLKRKDEKWVLKSNTDNNLSTKIYEEKDHKKLFGTFKDARKNAVAQAKLYNLYKEEIKDTLTVLLTARKAYAVVETPKEALRLLAEIKHHLKHVKLLEELATKSKNSKIIRTGLHFGTGGLGDEIYFTELPLLGFQNMKGQSIGEGHLEGVRFTDGRINYHSDKSDKLVYLASRNLPFESINYLDSDFSFRTNEGHIKGIEAKLTWVDKVGEESKNEKDRLQVGQFSATIDQLKFKNLRYVTEQFTIAIGDLTINGLSLNLSKDLGEENGINSGLEVLYQIVDLLANVGALGSLSVFSMIEQVNPEDTKIESAASELQDLLTTELYEKLKVKLSFESLEISNLMDTENGFIENLKLGASRLDAHALPQDEPTNFIAKRILKERGEALSKARNERAKYIGKTRRFDKANKEVKALEATYNVQYERVKRGEQDQQFFLAVTTEKLQLQNAKLLEILLKSNFESQLQKFDLTNSQGLENITIDGAANIETTVSPKGNTDTIIQLPLFIPLIESPTFQHDLGNNKLLGKNLKVDDIRFGLALGFSDFDIEKYYKLEQKEQEKRNPIKSVGIREITLEKLVLKTVEYQNFNRKSKTRIANDFIANSAKIGGLIIYENGDVNTNNLRISITKAEGKDTHGFSSSMSLINGSGQFMVEHISLLNSVNLGRETTMFKIKKGILKNIDFSGSTLTCNVKDLSLNSYLKTITIKGTIHTILLPFIQYGNGQDSIQIGTQKPISINSIGVILSVTNQEKITIKTIDLKELQGEEIKAIIQGGNKLETTGKTILKGGLIQDLIWGFENGVWVLKSLKKASFKTVDIPQALFQDIHLKSIKGRQVSLEHFGTPNSAIKFNDIVVQAIEGKGIRRYLESNSAIQTEGIPRLENLRIVDLLFHEKTNNWQFERLQKITFKTFSISKVGISEIDFKDLDIKGVKVIRNRGAYAYEISALKTKLNYNGKSLIVGDLNGQLKGSVADNRRITTNLTISRGLQIVNIDWSKDAQNFINSYNNAVKIDRLVTDLELNLSENNSLKQLKIKRLRVNKLTTSGFGMNYNGLDIRLPKNNPISFRNLVFANVLFDFSKKGLAAISTGIVNAKALNFQKLSVIQGTFLGNYISLNPSLFLEGFVLEKTLEKGIEINLTKPKLWLESAEFSDYNGSYGEKIELLESAIKKNNEIKQNGIHLNLTNSISNAAKPLLATEEMELIIDENGQVKGTIKPPKIASILLNNQNSTIDNIDLENLLLKAIFEENIEIETTVENKLIFKTKKSKVSFNDVAIRIPNLAQLLPQKTEGNTSIINITKDYDFLDYLTEDSRILLSVYGREIGLVIEHLPIGRGLHPDKVAFVNISQFIRNLTLAFESYSQSTWANKALTDLLLYEKDNKLILGTKEFGRHDLFTILTPISTDFNLRKKGGDYYLRLSAFVDTIINRQGNSEIDKDTWAVIDWYLRKILKGVMTELHRAMNLILKLHGSFDFEGVPTSKKGLLSSLQGADGFLNGLFTFGLNQAKDTANEGANKRLATISETNGIYLQNPSSNLRKLGPYIKCDDVELSRFLGMISEGVFKAKIVKLEEIVGESEFLHEPFLGNVLTVKKLAFNGVGLEKG